MKNIFLLNADKYPNNIPWENKSFSMPNIPRGDIGMLECLKQIFELIKNHVSSSHQLNFEGSISRISLGDACVRLRPVGLVVKTQTGYSLSKEAELWLENNDNLYLAAVLCSRVKFLGETLYYLDEPKTASQLQEIAANDYSLNWKTKSDINARLVWLRQFGLVEFQEFSLLYNRTDLGNNFIKHIQIEKPIKPLSFLDETESEKNINVSDWAIDLCNNCANIRKSTIGYIPGDLKQFDITLFDFIQLINGGNSFEQINSFADTTLSISPSSLRSFLTTLSNLNLIVRKTNIIYDITDLAKKWAEERKILDLLCIFHHSFGYIFEMLNILNSKPCSYKELAAISKDFFGFERENIEEIRKRILLLKSAKLVRNESVDTFTVTHRAKMLLNLIVVETKELEENTVEPCINTSTIQNDNSSFFTELRLASKDSSNYEHLERLVKIAFDKLGFETQLLGGSGKTDVLIKSSGISSNAFSVAVDAKSTITGNVTDGLVDFDTLMEHRKKHKADFSAIVGGNFQNERLIKRAIEHNVVLIDVDTLKKLIINHTQIPLKTISYKKLFQHPGIADISCLDEDRMALDRYGNLIHETMDCLISELDDPVTKGILQVRDIYMALRKNEAFKFVPNVDEISNILDFLSSPLIGCVERCKYGYYAVGTLKDAAQKFEFFSKMCT